MQQENSTPLSNHGNDPAEVASLGLRERKKRIRLQSIISAARKLFVSKGFSNTTIQEISEEAGVGLGTLYLYAKSKEDLLVMVFKEDILQMIDRSYHAINTDAPLLEQIMAFFDVHINYHKQDMTLSRTVLKELSFSGAAQRQEDIEQIMKKTYERLMGIFQRAVEKGRITKEIYPGTAAWSTFALYYHLLQGFLCGFHTEDEFRKTLRHALVMLLE